MKKTFVILTFVFTGVLSCTSQLKQLGEGIFDLQKLSFHEFNAEQYFKDVINNYDYSYSIKKEIIATNGFVLDSNEKDTLGYSYATSQSTANDKLASYHKLFFSEIEAITTLKGDLLALHSYASYNDSLVVNETIKIMNQKFNDAEVFKDDFFGEYTCRTWYKNDDIIQLVTSTRYIPVFYLDRDENNNETTVTEHEPKLLTRLFITNKKNTKKIRGKLNHGDWLFFK